MCKKKSGSSFFISLCAFGCPEKSFARIVNPFYSSIYLYIFRYIIVKCIFYIERELASRNRGWFYWRCLCMCFYDYVYFLPFCTCVLSYGLYITKWQKKREKKKFTSKKRGGFKPTASHIHVYVGTTWPHPKPAYC